MVLVLVVRVVVCGAVVPHQWRSYRGPIAPPPLALENGKFGNLQSGGK